MIFTVGAPLLDALVLAIAEQGDTYGYAITQTLHRALDVSESTLYPILRRLQKDACLTVYDKAISGRNRRYYSISEAGRRQLALYRAQWPSYRDAVDSILEGRCAP